MKQLFTLLLLILTTGLLWPAGTQAQENLFHAIEPGDTWIALSWRYGLSEGVLRAANPHPNPARQPAVGDTIVLPPAETTPRSGRLLRSYDGGLLRLAAQSGRSAWELTVLNDLPHPLVPLYGRPLYIPGEGTLRDLPAGFDTLELFPATPQPGRALAFQAQASTVTTPTAWLDNLSMPVFVNGRSLLGLGATGAFYPAGLHELTISTAGQPAWSQPWRFVDGSWDYDRVTLTGEAAAIDEESIAAERAHLFEIWSQITPRPLWQGAFQLPIESYLQISSNYGARRSYNGGPFRSYHEGVDFSAYGGTPVFAPAGGTVVLAERLYVRGGAVIIDHGLGIYSGYYHLSNVLASAGQTVELGMLIGEVGTTGLSSGNHLHWDLLVNGIWVDASAWLEQDMACWLLAAWGGGCAS